MAYVATRCREFGEAGTKVPEKRLLWIIPQILNTKVYLHEPVKLRCWDFTTWDFDLSRTLADRKSSALGAKSRPIFPCRKPLGGLLYVLHGEL